MISCVDDMVILLRAIIEVDPAVSAGCGFFWRAFKVKPERGWAAFSANGRTGSGGRSNGYKSYYMLYPRRKTAVVILANTNSFEIDAAAGNLARGLLTLAPPAR